PLFPYTTLFRSLVLDEWQGEQQLDAALDQHVATERQWVLIRVGKAPITVRDTIENLTCLVGHTTGRTPRPQAAILETAHRVEAPGVIVLVEGQSVAIAKTIAKTELRMEPQAVLIAQRLEDLATVI